jgi:hypothetical protein
MGVAVEAAVLFAAARDNRHHHCSSTSVALASSYLFAALGVCGARWRGRRTRTGLCLGLLFGPLGVIVACSNPVPKQKIRLEKSTANT